MRNSSLLDHSRPVPGGWGGGGGAWPPIFFIEFDSILFSKMVFGLCIVA